MIFINYFRDIKSDQILLHGCSAKLSGFGFSAQLENRTRSSLVITYKKHKKNHTELYCSEKASLNNS